MTDRPASFDRLLLDHMDALREVASYLSKYGADEIVADTVELTLRRWANFDPAKGTFYNWLVWQARDAARSFRGVTQEAWDNEVAADLPLVAVPPTQPCHAQLSAVLAHLSGIKNGDVLLRRAMGDTHQEIANDRGVSRSRIQQLEKEARGKLVRRAG